MASPPRKGKAGSDSAAVELSGDWRLSEAIGWLFFCLATAAVQSFSSKLFASRKLLTDRDTSNDAKIFTSSHPFGEGDVREIVAYFKETLM